MPAGFGGSGNWVFRLKNDYAANGMCQWNNLRLDMTMPLPPSATRTPTGTITASSTPSSLPTTTPSFSLTTTPSSLPTTPSSSPTTTDSSTPSFSPSITPSLTNTPSATSTDLPTLTPTPTESPTLTPTPTESPSETSTPTPSPSDTPSPTSLPSESFSPTGSPSPSSSNSPSTFVDTRPTALTPSDTPTATPTQRPPYCVETPFQFQEAIASASSVLTGFESSDASNVLDSSTGNWWHSGDPDASSEWLALTFPYPRTVLGYILTPRAAYPTYFPSDWIFQGSTDGVNWETIEVVSGMGSEAVSQELDKPTGPFIAVRWFFTTPGYQSIGEASVLSCIDPDLPTQSPTASPTPTETPTRSPPYCAMSPVDFTQGSSFSASSILTGYESCVPANAFDSNTGTWWHSDGSPLPQWLTITFDLPRTVTGYYTGPRRNFPSLFPLQWKFQGSYDGVNFIDDLDTTGAEGYRALAAPAGPYLAVRWWITSQSSYSCIADAYVRSCIDPSVPSFTPTPSPTTSSTTTTSPTPTDSPSSSPTPTSTETDSPTPTATSTDTATPTSSPTPTRTAPYCLAAPVDFRQGESYAASSVLTGFESCVPANAFDGTTSTWWHTNGASTPQWLSITFAFPRVVSGYSTYQRSIGSYFPNQWIFQGSYDGVNFVDNVDTYGGQGFRALAAPAGPYKAVRWYITSQSSYSSIGEASIRSCIDPSVPTFTPTITPTISPSSTPSPTPSPSPPPSPTLGPTPTSTTTPTITPTSTTTPTITPTPTSSPTASRTPPYCLAAPVDFQQGVSYAASSVLTGFESCVPANAFDGTTGTWWHTNGAAAPQWLSITFAFPRVVTGYSTYQRSVGSYFPNQWIFQGSYDGVNFVDNVDTFGGQGFRALAAPAGPYKAVRWYITSQSSYSSIGEASIRSCIDPAVPTFTPTSTFTLTPTPSPSPTLGPSPTITPTQTPSPTASRTPPFCAANPVTNFQQGSSFAASTVLTGFESCIPSNAFDGTTGTWWHSNGAAAPQWLSITFPSPRVVLGYYTVQRSGGGFFPVQWTLQGSYDGTNFVDNIDTYGSQGVRNLPTPVGPYKAVRWWITSQSSYSCIGEAYIISCQDPFATRRSRSRHLLADSSVTKCEAPTHWRHGVSSASSEWAGHESTNAFDGSLSTGWHAASLSPPHWLMLTFTSPRIVTGFTAMTDVESMNEVQVSKSVALQGSYDGSWSNESEDYITLWSGSSNSTTLSVDVPAQGPFAAVRWWVTPMTDGFGYASFAEVTVKSLQESKGAEAYVDERRISVRDKV
eukprot:CAMPEP_0184672274 /NCGR_PEP_ID=MMETSP0308-20130426/86003_1 /TAXON_ID=38269 /ORGANISM="Gloeochaete witrockiana, Strain SAG 46.84" /LENGTH=1286 /DNA_ID=CAMNT_0027119571 /DNA_START=527 /DNA_END=4388 /DNA_ORIENTATION=+